MRLMPVTYYYTTDSKDRHDTCRLCGLAGIFDHMKDKHGYVYKDSDTERWVIEKLRVIP